MVKRYALGALCVVTVLLSFYFFAAPQPLGGQGTLLSRIASLLVSPVGKILTWGKSSAQGIYHNYIDLVHVRQEAELLRKENLELKNRFYIYADVSQENIRLRKLLHYTQTAPFELINAEIIGRDPSFIYESVKINRGEKHAIAPGMGVVSADGVVGVVMRVHYYESDVLLLTDPNSNLDVVVARNRHRGVLQGGMGRMMRFESFERGGTLFVGDEIVTSGLTGAFPSGIPVGSVVAVSSSGRVIQDIDVQPAIDLSHLREVLVLKLPNREMDLIRQLGGKDWMKKMLERTNE